MESVYEIVLVYELKKRGLKVKWQVPVTIVYDDIKFDEGFRADLIVEGKIIVELKSVEKVVPVHKKTIVNLSQVDRQEVGIINQFRFGINT